MSQETVEIVRRAIEYFGETGQVAVECYDPEIEFTTRSDGPGQTTYHGVDGLRRSVEDFREAWASTTFEAEEFIETNDAVVVPLLFHLRAQSGVGLDVEEAWAYWVRNGKIWRMEQHASKQEALEAAGLSE
jgi:ketosteroid isomerase-like protein